MGEWLPEELAEQEEVVITGFTLEQLRRLTDVLYRAPGGHGDLLDLARDNYTRIKKEKVILCSSEFYSSLSPRARSSGCPRFRLGLGYRTPCG